MSSSCRLGAIDEDLVENQGPEHHIWPTPVSSVVPDKERRREAGLYCPLLCDLTTAIHREANT
jgi:hypothetical protein